jgi:hypothetical protein
LRPASRGSRWVPPGAAERRRHTEIDFGLGKGCAVTGDGEMDGFGDFATAAEREPVDGGNHRFPERFQACSHGLSAPDEVAHRGIGALANTAGKFVDVGASGECALAGAVEHHDAHAGINLDLVEQGHQAVDQLVAERVELVGAVGGDQRDPVVDFEQYGVGHRVLSWRAALRAA